jgi:hypothetical protein
MAHHQYGWHAFQYLTVVRWIPDALLSIRLPGAAVGAGTRQIRFPPHWAIREVLLLSTAVRDHSPAKVRDGDGPAKRILVSSRPFVKIYYP